jgi:hypothetical protein
MMIKQVRPFMVFSLHSPISLPAWPDLSSLTHPSVGLAARGPQWCRLHKTRPTISPKGGACSTTQAMSLETEQVVCSVI